MKATKRSCRSWRRNSAELNQAELTLECRICDIEMLTRVQRRCCRSILVAGIRCELPLLEIALPSSYCRSHNLKQDDIEYAIENTQVILAPERQIATFGNTSFEFHLISELMDRVDQVRIRTGRIEAERPKILSPEYILPNDARRVW